MGQLLVMPGKALGKDAAVCFCLCFSKSSGNHTDEFCTPQRLESSRLSLQVTAQLNHADTLVGKETQEGAGKPLVFINS